MRGIGRLAFQRGHQHRLNLLVADPAGPARARFIGQSVQPLRQETAAATYPPSAATHLPRPPPLCWICLLRNPTRCDTAAPVPCADFARRAHRCSVSRSSSVSTNSAAGSPRLAMNQVYSYSTNSRRTTLGRHRKIFGARTTNTARSNTAAYRWSTPCSLSCCAPENSSVRSRYGWQVAASLSSYGIAAYFSTE